MKIAHIYKNYLIYAVLIFLVYKQLTPNISTEPCEKVIVQESRPDNKYEDAKIRWAESVMRNLSNKTQQVDTKWSDLYNAMPHLRGINVAALEPIYLLGSPPKRKKMIMAIPAIERPQDTYLLATLKSLIEQLRPDDRENISIIVFLSHEGGADSPFVKNTTAEIQKHHSKDISDGLLQVLLIPVLFYPPNLDTIPATYNDSSQRMYWRTKQNLDYIYSMTHASHLADYYLQLEDDIIAAKGYVKNIFYQIETKEDIQWIMLEFCSLGVIGKLYRTSDLHLYISVLSIFFKQKPVDWIIEDFLRSMYCSLEWNSKRCKEEVSKHRILYEPIQFQHMGKYSSLKGKIQKLKEKSFGGVSLKKKRNNPAGKVESNIQAIDVTHSLYNAYKSSSYFHSASRPKQGDYINFVFDNPTKMKAILLTTGNTANPNMTFGEETVVYMTDDSLQTQELGHFTDEGRFFHRMSGKIVRKIRVEVRANLTNSVILEQIAFTFW